LYKFTLKQTNNNNKAIYLTAQKTVKRHVCKLVIGAYWFMFANYVVPNLNHKFFLGPRRLTKPRNHDPWERTSKVCKEGSRAYF
jgi:hypothetical protein